MSRPGQPLSAWCLFDSNLEEMPLVDALSYTYPRAVAGEIFSFGLNRDSGEFYLEFEPDRQITAPTEIYIPVRRHYPEGWRIYCHLSENQWRHEWDTVAEV